MLHRKVDITDEPAVKNLLQEFAPSLKGIIHSAGISENAILANQSWDQFERVFAPKVKGALSLHNCTEELGIKLDFMVFFSSISSLLGIPGQSNYSAANAFLDALAYLRKTKNLPSLSINWGAWEETGMMTETPELISLLNRRLPGVKNLKNSQGEEGFKAALNLSIPQVMIAPIDKKELKDLSPTLKLLFSDLLPKEEMRVEKTLLEEDLAKLSPIDRKGYLQNFLKEKLCFIFGMALSANIALEKGFFDLGMDSLMAVEFKNLLQNALGKAYPLPETLAFDYPNLAALTQYIHSLLEHKILEKAAAVQMTYLAEPIAIIGLGCRFPGGSRDPESFWKFLLEGKDGICASSSWPLCRKVF